ncbi:MULTISPECIES: S9 family peptidase [Bacillus cereus group]|uniref:S9 family peptidase n=1 Tax=Bacillus cereus group TaxID=86661 RepID=UPI001298A755|nr:MULTISPECIES: S9 family peptidase [Bacillus cereus group]MCR6789655.1 S9 family peptidase [Bacillus thuringiensis]MCR6826097.1 S9 family peptidase [Bacillus thuringiensis]MCR6828193.1 S9 family peptidase [Bacillus thuringiensis]MEB8928082.1 S9 family peptidase [Bacillus cereus]MEB9327547.1 S9 family peptidase [Bacillus cereus]
MKVKAKTYLSIEEIISLPTVSSTNISDDGKNVAFVKKTADWKDNIYRNHVWIYEKDKKQSYPLSNGDIDSTHPLWSPDARFIAYLSPVGDGENQIFVKSLDDYREVQITDEKEGVSTFKWGPTGKGLYYVTQSKECEEIKKRKDLYGDFQHIGKEHQNNCLYYIEIEKVIQSDTDEHENRVVYQLTDGKDFHIHEFDISNDGKKVVFITTPSSNMADYINGDLYILHIKAGELQKLNVDKLLGGSVCFSPDGSKICYKASIREKDYYRNHIQDSTLEIYDINTGQVIQPVTDFDSTVMPLQWTAKGVLIRWQDKTNYRIGLLAEDGTVEALSDKIDGFIMDASITKDGNHITYNKAITNETFEIYLDDKKITDENSFFKGKLKSNREIISWKSSDGLEIEGVLSTPVEFDTNKKYPLLVVIHGGPNWASFPIFSDCFNEKYPIEQFVEKGFIVLEPNYRGSSGYGNEFLKANYRKQGFADYDDVISGVEALVKKGIVDKDRVGVMGWSNGGYISAFCSTFSSRFKAISVGDGITNWSTHYVNTDIPYFIRMYLGDNPWNDPEIYKKISPMTYIKSACTPTLIQHGEKDVRIPITNAYELYEGLRAMEVDTELIIFKGMAYSSNQPGMRVAIMKQNLMWFSHYILGESMRDFSTI